MRPQEFLGMVEKPPVTRMFEERKGQARENDGQDGETRDEITLASTEDITTKY